MPLTDEEIADIKREAQEAKALAQQAKAEKDQLQANYAADMRTVGNWMEEQRRAAQPPAPAEPEDDDDGMSETKVRRLIQETVQQPAARLGAGLFEQNRTVARLTNPDYVKYAGVVDALVHRMVQTNPDTVSDPNLFKHATDVVRLQHLDDIVEERVAERARRPLTDDDYDAGVEEGEAPAAAVAAPAPASASTRAPLVAPSGAPSRAAAQRTRSRVVLDPEERKWADRFKLSPEQFDNLSDHKYSPDVLGFRDKDGNTRERV